MFVHKTYLASRRWLSSDQSSKKLVKRKLHHATQLKLHLGPKHSGGREPKYIDVTYVLLLVVHKKQDEATVVCDVLYPFHTLLVTWSAPSRFGSQYAPISNITWCMTHKAQVSLGFNGAAPPPSV